MNDSDYEELPPIANAASETANTSDYEELPSKYNGTSNTPFGTQDPNSTHAAINRWLMENVPSVIHGLANFAKGIPITGQMVDDNTIPGHEQYNKEHPVISTLEKGAGALATAVPLSAAAALPEAGLGANMLTQGGLFGGLGTADKVSQKYSEGGWNAVKNTPASEYGTTAAVNTAAGALGPVLGKIISPNMLSKTLTKEIPDAYDISDETLRRLPKEAFDDLYENMNRKEFMENVYKNMGTTDKPSISLKPETNQAILDAMNSQKKEALTGRLDKALDSDTSTKLTGAVAGWLAGGFDPTSGILGEMVAPHLKGPVTSVLRNYLANQKIGPAQQSILNSLLGESANTATNSQ